MEKDIITEALKNSGSVRKTAKYLGIGFSTLRYWIQKHDIFIPKKIRVCKVCSENDPTLFYPHNSTICKSCFSDYVVNRYTRLKKEMIAYAGGKCVCCGYNRYYGGLDFHHRDPNAKDADWGIMRRWSVKRIKTEIDKCVLVCATCHREIHGGIRIVSPVGSDPTTL